MKKILSIFLCLCLVIQCFAFVVSAENRINFNVDMPNIDSIDTTAEIPNILNIIGKQKPTVKEEYDYLIDLSADTTITQCNFDVPGTYYVYASDEAAYAAVDLILAENISAYITIDNITFNNFRSTQNSSAEINVIGNVICKYYTNTIGTGNLVISADTTDCTFTTCGIFSGNIDTIYSIISTKTVAGNDISAYDNGNLYINNVTVNSLGRIGAAPTIRYQDSAKKEFEFFKGNYINDIVFNNAIINIASFNSNQMKTGGNTSVINKKIIPSSGIGGNYNNIKIYNSKLNGLSNTDYKDTVNNSIGSLAADARHNYIGGQTKSNAKITSYNSIIDGFNYELGEPYCILFGTRTSSSYMSWDKHNVSTSGYEFSNNSVDIIFSNSNLQNETPTGILNGIVETVYGSDVVTNSVVFDNCTGEVRGILNTRNVYVYNGSDITVSGNTEKQYIYRAFDITENIYVDGSSLYSNTIIANEFVSNNSTLILNNMGAIRTGNLYKVSEENIISTNSITIDNCDIKAFVNGNAHIFDTTKLNVSDDTLISCWCSSTYDMNASPLLLSSEKLDNLSSNFVDNFFTTRITTLAKHAQTAGAIFDVDNPDKAIDIRDFSGFSPSIIFYGTDQIHYKLYEVPEKIKTEYCGSSTAKVKFDFSNGYFITNDTGDFKDLEFYILNIESTTYFNALLKLFTLEGMKVYFSHLSTQITGQQSFDFSTVENGLNSIKNLIDCTEDDVIYKSAEKLLTACLSYNGKDITSEDVKAAALKSIEEVTKEYANADEKDKLEGQEVSDATPFWIKYYLHIANWAVKASEADLADNTIDSAAGLSRALSLQINTLGNLCTFYAMYGIGSGSNDFEACGFSLLQYFDTSGVYHTLFNLADKYVDNQNAVSIVSFRTNKNEPFEYENFSFFIPDGYSLSSSGISLQDFPNKYLPTEKENIENNLTTNDKKIEVYNYYNASGQRATATFDELANTAAPFLFNWSVITTTLIDKQYTINYHTDGLGDIVCEKANGIKTTMDTYSVIQSHGYSINYTDLGYNKGGGDKKVSQWTRVHYSLDEAKKQQAEAGTGMTNKYYYFVPNQNNFIGWQDENGNLFDFSKPVLSDVELYPKYKKLEVYIYSVKIPKSIVMNGRTGSGNYTVSVSGKLSPASKVVVSPAPDFYLYSQTNLTAAKSSIRAMSIQNKTTWLPDELSVENWNNVSGTISVPEISAGKWKGNIRFNIQIKST